MNYILFDIGATNTRVARSLGKKIDVFVEHKTPEKYGDAIKLICETAEKISGNRKIGAVAGGVPGTLSGNGKILLEAKNLPHWGRQNMMRDLEKKLHAPVMLENDATLAGLGEVVHGAGKRNTICVYVTVSTGVNGVRVVSGVVDPHAFGVNLGRQCIGPHQETLEDLVGGKSIKQRYGKSAEKITSKKAWREITKWLALGLSNTAAVWSPEIIVLGGSVMRSVPFDDLEKEFKNNLSWLKAKKPRLARAKLQGKSGVFGALALIQNKKVWKS